MSPFCIVDFSFKYDSAVRTQVGDFDGYRISALFQIRGNVVGNRKFEYGTASDMFAVDFQFINVVRSDGEPCGVYFPVDHKVLLRRCF